MYVWERWMRDGDLSPVIKVTFTCILHILNLKNSNRDKKIKKSYYMKSGYSIKVFGKIIIIILIFYDLTVSKGVQYQRV